MKIKEIKVGNEIFKLACGFDTESEIIEGVASGKLDFYIVDANTAETDKYTFNVAENKAVITDNSQNTIVAKGLDEINNFLQNNNLASIVDIIALEEE